MTQAIECTSNTISINQQWQKVVKLSNAWHINLQRLNGGSVGGHNAIFALIENNYNMKTKTLKLTNKQHTNNNNNINNNSITTTTDDDDGG